MYLLKPPPPGFLFPMPNILTQSIFNKCLQDHRLIKDTSKNIGGALQLPFHSL